MIFSKEIAKLKADLVAAEAKLGTAVEAAVKLAEDKFAEEKGSLTAHISDLEAAAKEAVSKADHEAAIALKHTKISELEGKIEAAGKDIEKKVKVQVIEKIAEAGVPAAVRDPKAVDNPAKPASADGVSPQQRLAAATRIAGSNK